MPEEPGPVPAMRGGPGMPERTGQTFEAALDRIRPAAQALTPSTWSAGLGGLRVLLNILPQAGPSGYGLGVYLASR